MNWKDRITVDPQVLVGKPIIRGTRISVELLMDRLADGWSMEQILDSYPRVTREDVLAAIADPIPLSALQHWCYCPRQCALIHVEQVFADNLHTLRGQAVHRQVDQPGVETRAGLRVERALPVWSDRLGLIGKADVVEFEADGTPYPVEYKHGSRNKAPWIAACDDLQLAAQACVWKK
jgi:uncharacterized protein (DUF433 family)